jgi:hypothetical protein
MSALISFRSLPAICDADSIVFGDSGCPASACSTLVSRVACELAPRESDARRLDRPVLHVERRRDADDGVVRGALMELRVRRGLDRCELHAGDHLRPTRDRP